MADRLLSRIGITPGVLGGKPYLLKHRLAVEHVLSMLEAGETLASLMDAFPSLEIDDIKACISYARRLVERYKLSPAELED